MFQPILLVEIVMSNVSYIRGDTMIFGKGEDNLSAKLREADVVSISEKYAEGASIKDLSTEFGVSKATIKKALLGATWKDVDRRIFNKREIEAEEPYYPSKLYYNDVLDIVNMYSNGDSIGYIAQKFGVSNQTISKILKGQSYKHIPREIFCIGHKKKLTEDQIESIKARYMSGETQTKLAKEHNISVNAISKYIKDNGLIPYTRLEKKYIPSIIQYYKDGYTYKQIAKMYGVSARLIAEYINSQPD